MIEMENGIEYDVVQKSVRQKLTSNVGIVAERFSFGKTFLIPALIVLQPSPLFQSVEGSFRLGGNHHSCGQGEIRSNIVICSHKTMKEWIKNIEDCTTLTYCKIVSVKNLESLREMVEKEKYSDIILIKDGFNTVKGEKKETLEWVMEILRERVFSRVIVDDYDMLKMKSSTPLPEALFVWLLSSTFKHDFPTSLVSNSMGRIMKAGIVLKFYYYLRCNSDYSAVEFNIPRIEYFETEMDEVKLCRSLIEIGTVSSRERERVKSDVFLTATRNEQYRHDPSKTKILFSLEEKSARVKVVERLKEEGLKAVKMDGRNLHLFSSDENSISVCGLIHGVNMGYLTHIILREEDYSQSEINQIVGRAQRISRTQNLQVYFVLPLENEVLPKGSENEE
jgi:hypothetical protein